MEIIYTCPKCGADLIDVCLATNPPQYHKQCPSCGWKNKSEMKEREIIRIPWQKNNVGSYTITSIPSPCTNCPNHPSNGGSGICYCTLGTLVATC